MGHFTAKNTETAKAAGAGDTDPNETRIPRMNANWGRGSFNRETHEICERQKGDFDANFTNLLERLLPSPLPDRGGEGES